MILHPAAAMLWSTDLDRHLAWLLSGGGAGLGGGAELEVRHPNASVAFLAPLARHHRIDPEASDGERICIWIRPITGGYSFGSHQVGDCYYAFDLADARRRNLTFTSVDREGDTLIFDLESGQLARIRPARQQFLAELQRWDSWYYLQLTAAEQAELDALELDSG